MDVKRKFSRIRDIILDYSKADGTEVLYVLEDHALTRFSGNSITQNIDSRGDYIAITVIVGKKSAKVTTNQFDAAALRKKVDQALDLAGRQRDNPSLPPLFKPQQYEVIKGYSAKTASASPEERAQAAAYAAGIAGKKRLDCSGSFMTGVDAIGIANSKGLFAVQKNSVADFSVTMTTPDSSGWAAAANKNINLIDQQAVADRALQKALSSRKPKPLKPGRYDVIFEPQPISEFLFFLAYECFNGLAYVENRSLLSGNMGKKLFGENVTIYDDVYHPMNNGLPFDFEGMPRKKLLLVEKGVVRNVVHDRYSARKARATSTGHSLPQPNTFGPIPLNMIMERGDSSLEEMIASTKRGLLVTQFHYSNVINEIKMNLTGMTRNGTFMIENGRITYPVKNLRYTEAVPRALSNVEMISRDQTFVKAFFGGGFVVPVVKIKDFTFTSETEF